VVKSLECIGCLFPTTFVIDDPGIAGNDGFPLDAWESLGENGDGCRLLLFAHDGCKGLFLLLLAYASVEAFGPGENFGRVSPDIQGFLWAWGSRHSDVWCGRWGGRGSVVGRLSMWFVVGCIVELLAHFLKFGGDAR
jgi:hypothetical protein